LNKKVFLLGVTTGLILILDQITKFYVDSSMRLHESIPVIQGFFSITYVRNPGAAFGFLADASPLFRSIFFVAVTGLAVILVVQDIWKSRAEEPLLTFALSLILSGAVGNLIDRVRLGEVIDFLDVYIGSTHWPAFNVADSAISVGAVILFIELTRRGREMQTDSKGSQP
jgi:signal peptidase II